VPAVAGRGRAAGALGALAGLAACLAATACRPAAEAAPEIALRWTVEPKPAAVGLTTVCLTLTDTTTGQPVSGASVRLEGDMSHPGMAPVFSHAREVRAGRYEAPLELTMAGDWLLLIEATLRDGRTLRRQARLPGVGPRLPGGSGP